MDKKTLNTLEYDEIKNKIEPIVNSIKSIDEVMHNYLKSRGNGW